MPGPRTDKKRAWETLEELLGQHREIATFFCGEREEPVKLFWHEDERLALTMLKTSGRLDAAQIRLIRKLCQAVIRVERNCDP